MMGRRLLLVVLILATSSCTWLRKKPQPMDSDTDTQSRELQAAIADVEAEESDETAPEVPQTTLGASPRPVTPPARRPSAPPGEPAATGTPTGTYEPDAGIVGGSVAVVNGTLITKEDVLGRVRGDLEAIGNDASLTPVGKAAKQREVISRAVMQKVERTLAVQEARRVMTEEEAGRIEANVDSLVADSIRRAGTSTKLEGLLAEKGTTLEAQRRSELDNRLIRGLLIREVDAQVDVTPSEMRAYYESHRADYANKKQVQVRQIFLKRDEYPSIDEAVTKARDLRGQLRRGADFGRLAAQYSDGPYAKQGGLWEFVTEGGGTFPPKVEAAVFGLPAKRLSDVIVTPIGVHLIRVEDVRMARQAPFAEVQEEIATKLREQERQRLYRGFIRQLWAKSHVDIHWE